MLKTWETVFHFSSSADLESDETTLPSNPIYLSNIATERALISVKGQKSYVLKRCSSIMPNTTFHTQS